MGEDDGVTEAGTEEHAAPAAPATPALTPSDAALARHRARMRRGGITYFSIVAVVVGVLVAGAAVAWSRGEGAHATLHTSAPPPSSLGLNPPSATPQPAWRTTDRLAIGTPQAGG